VHGDTFANRVPVANDQPRSLTVKFKILRILADGGKLEYAVVPADACRPFNDDMRADNSAGFYLDLRTHNTVRTNFNIVRNHGRFIDDRGFVYHGG
jgi:hypothetical protein